jgi:hypothetical protein
MKCFKAISGMNCFGRRLKTMEVRNADCRSSCVSFLLLGVVVVLLLVRL